MKQLNYFISGIIFLFCISAIVISISSCAQKKAKSNEVIVEEETKMDSIVKANTPDTAAVAPVDNLKTAKEEPAPEYKPATPKICDPNFNLIASPKKNQKIFYVSGFNPGEFKCWESLVSHSQKTCNGSPCVIYFVDKPTITPTTTGPHYIDANTLKTNGIARYEYNGANWEIKGSSMWGRKEKGYAYYNTDNAGGG